MHLDLASISRLLYGRTRTATFTDSTVDILPLPNRPRSNHQIDRDPNV